MVLLIIGIVIIIYVFLLMISLSYSCGGYSFKDCGLCWIGIVQSPLDLIGSIITKCINIIKKR